MQHDRTVLLRTTHGLGRVPSRLCVRHLRGDSMSAALITLTGLALVVALPVLLVRLTGGTTTVHYTHRTPTRRAPKEG